MKRHLTLAAVGLLASAGLALAGPGHDDGHGHAGAAIGSPGEASNVDREISVSMNGMDFHPEEIEVKAGETIRFVVTNDGQMVHEFNIGTDETWVGHAQEMREMLSSGMMTARELHHEKMEQAGMMHDDPNSALLEPGETAEVVWTFPEKGTIGFACNVPGHREAGMDGRFELHRATPATDS